MDGLTLLREAWAAGLTVQADGERLRIRGPRRAEPIAQRLIAHKAHVLAALAAPPPPAQEIRVEDLSPDWRAQWGERAAIMEYDGKLPRERAEEEALAHIIEQMRRPPALSSDCPCRACRGDNDACI
jgi:hypothetical protein